MPAPLPAFAKASADLPSVALALAGGSAAAVLAAGLALARLSFARLAALATVPGRRPIRRSLRVAAGRMGGMRRLWRIRAGSRRLMFFSRRHGGAQLRNNPS
jgi:hypothetical protein